MIQALYNKLITVKRRLDISVASRDIFNNPIYGTPTTGWSTPYTNVPARIALSAKPLKFESTAERITPRGVVYIPPEFTVYHEDRIITPDGIEYVIVSVVPGYLNNNVIDHWEIEIDLP